MKTSIARDRKSDVKFMNAPRKSPLEISEKYLERSLFRVSSDKWPGSALACGIIWA